MSEFRRILALDVDGVLNSVKDKEADFMNPANMAILNQLYDELGFEVVLSSTWRIIFTMPQMDAFMVEFGAKFKLLDKTPKPWLLEEIEMPSLIPGRPSEIIYQGMTKRGDEIQLWLDNNHLTPGQNCSICILDDNSDMKHLTKYLVLTSMREGLHKGHLKQVRYMFAKQEKK